jgi:hypothetical protein
MSSWWPYALVAAVLLFIAASGVRMTLRPDLFDRQSFWHQGEMERTIDRDFTRVFGVVLAVGALWVLYRVLFTRS